jgi:signal transduction histidine kinase
LRVQFPLRQHFTRTCNRRLTFGLHNGANAGASNHPDRKPGTPRRIRRNKMSKMEFKLRSAERDRKNDDLRIERLDKVLQDVMSEVRRERTGLRGRYESSSDNAMQPLDAVFASGAAAGVKTESEASLSQLILRLKKLEAQEHVLQQMQQDLARLQGLSAE